MGHAGDRYFLHKIIETYGESCLAGTGKYTVRYRLGGNITSGVEEDFTLGKSIVSKYAYPGGKTKPWAVE